MSNMTDVQPIRREAGIDWLAMTRKRTDPLGELWSWRCRDAWGCGTGEERQIEVRQSMGYTGGYSNGVFVGEGSQGWYAYGDGEDAERLWYAAYAPGQRVTRLDLRVTLWYVPALSPGWSERIVNGRQTQPDGRRGKIATIRGFGLWEGDKTIYVGAPTSEEQGKIYDKGNEKKNDPYWHGAIRWEVRLRREQATYVAEQIYASGPANMPAMAASYVHNWFYVRGFRPPWEPGSEVAWASGARRDDRTASKLAWLYKQVRPSIEWLQEQGVDECVILSALGLQVGRSGVTRETGDGGS